MTHARPPRRTGAVNSIVELPFGPGDGDVRFADRREAGRRLAALLGDLRHQNPVVVGIPRGGVPVAAEVARALEAPLDLVLVRKIGAPGNPEYGIGALAEDNVLVIDEEAVRRLRRSPAELDAVVERARRELAERSASHYAKRPRLAVAGRTVLLVDDGLATGHTAQAAARSLRERGAARVILAVPVAAPASAAQSRGWVDDVVCVQTPADLWAIGLWYEDFSATSEEEVAALLGEPSGAYAQPNPKEDVMPSTKTRVNKINTVVIPVSDQDPMIAFYVEKLGFQKRADIPFGNGYRWVEVAPEDAETTIALAPPPQGKPTGNRETGIGLQTSDIDAYHDELKAAGVDVDAEVSRMGDPVPPLFWLRDPEGNSLMVVG